MEWRVPEKRPRQGRSCRKTCSRNLTCHLITISSKIQILPGQCVGGGRTQRSERCLASGPSPFLPLGSREHSNKGDFETLPHKLCKTEHRQMNHSLKSLQVLAYHYPMMKALPHSKVEINSKNNNLFIKKLGCNFSRGQLGAMHIFIISLGCVGVGLAWCYYGSRDFGVCVFSPL